MLIDFLFAIFLQTSQLVGIFESSDVVEAVTDDIVCSCSATATMYYNTRLAILFVRKLISNKRN